VQTSHKGTTLYNSNDMVSTSITCMKHKAGDIG